MAGEVDCGKSTLIGRLLYDTNSISSQAKEELEKTCRRLERGLEFAYLLDSFEEERLEEFTLDTTQAFLKFKGKELLLIDVPGHRQLLKNMLTGTSYADAAILVIDVQKSMEEQTRRHLYILKFLGIDDLVLAVNKMDLVSYNENDFKEAKRQLDSFLNEVGIKAGYVIPVSAKDGENLSKKSLRMSWYSGLPLLEAVNIFKRKEQIYDFCFPIQDVYETEREKIAVGRVVSGRVKRKDLLKSALLDAELKVKGIRVFDKNKLSAGPGENIGLVFCCPENGLKRGDLLYKGVLPKITCQIKARIFCLHPLSLGEELLLRSATQEVCAKISLIEESIDTASLETNKDPEGIKSADAAMVIITTEKPPIVEKFQDLPDLGRFVLEKNNLIHAVGIIY